MSSIALDPSEKITTCMSYGAAFANIFVGLTINDISIAIGILLAIFTFLINWFYKHKSMVLREKLAHHQLTETDLPGDE